MEGVRGTAERLGDLPSQGTEKRWKRRGLNDGTAGVVVAIAEAHRLAVRQIAVESKGLNGSLASSRASASSSSRDRTFG